MICKNCLKDWVYVEEYDMGKFRIKCKCCGTVIYGKEATLEMKNETFKEGYRKAINDMKGLLTKHEHN